VVFGAVVVDDFGAEEDVVVALFDGVEELPTRVPIMRSSKITAVAIPTTSH
jgi:hypothetical protein